MGEVQITQLPHLLRMNPLRSSTWCLVSSTKASCRPRVTLRPQVVNRRQLLDGFAELVDEENRIGQWAHNVTKPDKAQFQFYDSEKDFLEILSLGLGGVIRIIRILRGVSREAIIDLEL